MLSKLPERKQGSHAEITGKQHAQQDEAEDQGALSGRGHVIPATPIRIHRWRPYRLPAHRRSARRRLRPVCP